VKKEQSDSANRGTNSIALYLVERSREEAAARAAAARPYPRVEASPQLRDIIQSAAAGIKRVPAGSGDL